MNVPKGKKTPYPLLLLSEAAVSLSITILCIFCACIYGILQNQVVIRISFEYFSEGFNKKAIQGTIIENFLAKHPKNYTLWASVWGIISTWWIGAIFGVLLSISSRIGPSTPLSPKKLIPPIVCSLVLLGITVSTIALFRYLIWKEAPTGQLPKILSQSRFYIEKYNPPQHEKIARAYIYCLFIQQISYGFGIIYGFMVILWSIWQRYKR